MCLTGLYQENGICIRINKGTVPIVANPDSYTNGSSGDILGGKTEKWPFFVLYVAFDNFFCCGLRFI